MTEKMVAYLLYAVVLLVMVIGIANLMEWAKKVLFKNKASRLVIQLFAGVVTALAIALLYLTNIMQYPLAVYLGAHNWADMASIYIILYYLQYKANMKLIKKSAIKLAKEILKGKGFSEETADMLLSGILPKEEKCTRS